MPNIVPSHSGEMAITAVVRRKIFVVLGMHRSGTSLCASMLNLIGVNIADEVGAAHGNEIGHFERFDLVTIHDEILQALNRTYYSPTHDFPLPPGWWSDFAIKPHRNELTRRLTTHLSDLRPIGFKDPRMSRLLPLWKSIFADLDLDPVYIICLRNPAHVAESLRVRDELDIEIGEYRWLVYMVEGLRNTRGGKALFVNYEDWFDDNLIESQINRLIDFVGNTSGVDLSDLKNAMRAVVSDEMNRSSRRDSRIRKPIVRHYYNLVRRLADDTAEDVAGDVEHFNENFFQFQQLTGAFEKIVAQAQAEKQDLERSVGQQRQEKTELDRVFAEAQAAHASHAGQLEQAVAEAQARQAELWAGIAARDAELDAVRAQKADADRLLGEAQAAHAHAAGEAERVLQAASERDHQLEQAKAEAQARQAELWAGITARDAELDAVRAGKAEAERVLAESQASHAIAAGEAERMLQDASERVRQLEQANAEAQARQAELGAAVAACDGELEAVRAEKVEVERRLAEAQASPTKAVREDHGETPVKRRMPRWLLGR